MIDYEQLLASAKEHKPKIIVAGASAYPRVIDFQKFPSIKNVVDNAKTLAEGLTQRGWNLVSGGTDNHLILMDLSKTEIQDTKPP